MSRKPGNQQPRNSDPVWERRLEQSRRGEIELTDEELERFRAEHADMYLISQYLDDELSPAERAQVEARARTDAAFRLDLQIANAIDGMMRAHFHESALFGLFEKDGGTA